MEVNTEETSTDELENSINKFDYIMEERKIVKEKIRSAFKTVALILTGYLLCCLGLSIISAICLSVAAVGSITYLEIDNSKRRHKIATRYKNASFKLDEFKEFLKDSSPWLSFPDWERADWLNDIIEQLWPFLSNILLKKIQGKLESKIRKKFSSFKFNNIEFGTKPPKIDGIKVYKQDKKKNSIIIDFDIVYDGDGNICCEISNREIGTIKHFQLSINVRVILKPILPNAPIIGGAQIFFLNAPQLNFELDGLGNMPGFTCFVRNKIEELIKKRFVFPHNITKKFTKSMKVEELKILEPKGVLRVHVYEGRNLVKKDVTGKSDPYVVLNVGAETYKTGIISYSLNPQWDYWCEFMVLDYSVQHLDFTVFDKDFNGDDFMGSGSVDIEKVINGVRDQWIKLDSVSHGEIHLRFTWLMLSSDYTKLEEITQDTKWVLNKEKLSTGLLTVYIKSAQNLPRDKTNKKAKPDSYFVVTLGKNIYKGKVKKQTTDPAWEHGFSLLVPSPESDVLKISIINKETDESLAEFQYSVGQLALNSDLRVVDHELVNEDDVKLCMSLQLKILTEEFVDNDLEDDFSYSVSNNSSASVSRQISVEDIISKGDDSAVSEISPARFITDYGMEPKLSLGDIELTLSYNDLAQKFVVFVHKIRNLPLKENHPTDIPDPYVKLQLEGPGSIKIHKTKHKTDDCNPVYEQEFDFLISKSNLYKSKLIVSVKTKKFFSSKNLMGQIELEFENAQTLEDVSCRRWYQLKPK